MKLSILSSTGAGCDLIDHVKAQLPYALINGGITLIAYLIAGVMLFLTTFILNKINNKNISQDTVSSN